MSSKKKERVPTINDFNEGQYGNVKVQRFDYVGPDAGDDDEFMRRLDKPHSHKTDDRFDNFSIGSDAPY